LVFPAFRFPENKCLGCLYVYKKNKKKATKKSERTKVEKSPTDHFDFDGAITLASFGEHITGSLTEIAKFRGMLSLL